MALGTELQFSVSGQTFRVNPKDPEAMAVHERIRDAGQALDRAEVIQRIRDRTTAVVIPADRDRWVELLDSEVIAYATLRQIEAWMIEFTLNRRQRRRRSARMR